MAGLEIENSFGVLALDQQQWRDLRNGYGVAPSTALGTLNGECEVTINGTGDLGTGNSALSVGSGTVLFGGTTTSVSAQNVDIDAGQSNPRKDVVYIDTNGDAQVNKGSPASVPSDAPGNRFQTWKPAPYDMHDVDAVVLAEVWVPANASSIGASDVRDRRLRADLETRAFATDQVNNSAIGDSVNYIDPRWLARTDALVYSLDLQTLDGIAQSTGGTGSVTLNQGNVTLATGTTQDSDAAIVDTRSNEPWSWGKDRSYRTRVNFEDTQGPIYVIRGDITRTDKTFRHIGFAAEGGDLKGTVADGTTENKVTLVSGFSAGVSDLRYELDAGSVEFFVDGTSQGSTSTNVPSGTDRAAKMRVFVNNSGGTTDRSVVVDKIFEVQSP